MKVTFEDALNDCLDRMAEGEDISRCVAGYPEDADELVRLLEAARSTMQANSSLTFSPAAKARGLAKLNRALSRQRPSSRWRLPRIHFRSVPRPVLLGIFAIVITFGAVGSTTAASSDSVPGDPLYWLKSLKEKALLGMPRSEMGRAEAHASLASERGEEVRRLIARGKIHEAEDTMLRLNEHLNASAGYVGVLIFGDPLEMPAVRLSGRPSLTASTLKSSLEQDGTLMRVEMLRLLHDAPGPQQRRIRLMFRQSDLGYRVLLDALDGGSVSISPFVQAVPPGRYVR
ncbi:MAG: hypothetical protein IIB14_01740 [Chloroflexi bacterium]|nr:hypothetical protein [Chloroflexota bacterium]